MKLLYLIFSLCVLFSVHVKAWPTALDFSTDNGTGDGFVITNGSEPDIRRCDASSTSWERDINEIQITPDTCHRYGLIWAAHSNVLNKSETNLLKDTDNQASYNPSVVGEGWRLPTIKELVRLFDFSGNQVSEISFTNKGITDPVIAEWVKGVNGGYLISSTYRNISGNVNGDSNNEDFKHNQIFAIHIASGRVVTLRLTTSSMRLCLGIENTKGKCDEPGEKNSDEKNAFFDYANKDFYALKVRTQTASELGYE